MIIWSGWGIQVPLYVVVAFFISIMGITPLNLGDAEAAVGMGVTGAIAGAAIYFTARWIESKPGRVLIDAATQQSFEVKPSAGSFFFIPTRFWAFLTPLAGFLLAGLLIMNPTSPAGG